MATQVHVTNVETILPENTFIYSRTDLKGFITEANEAFAEISEYTVAELIGKPHNLVRHSDMPKESFADLWKSLKAGRPWQGLVKSRRSDGGFYWVVANVSPVRENRRIVGYQSLRQRPSREQVRAADDAYRLMRTGSRALHVEEGQAVPTRAPWIQFLFHPSTQFGWTSYAALLAAGFGFAFLFSEAPQPWLRISAGLTLALSAFGALTVRLYTLPHLQRDLENMSTYVESVLSSGDLVFPFKLDQHGRAALLARKITLLMSWVQSTVQCVGDAVLKVETATGQVLNGIREIDEAANSQNAASASVAAAATVAEPQDHRERRLPVRSARNRGRWSLAAGQ
jgi:aerotaxis receptor